MNDSQHCDGSKNNNISLEYEVIHMLCTPGYRRKQVDTRYARELSSKNEDWAGWTHIRLENIVNVGCLSTAMCEYKAVRQSLQAQQIK